MNTSERKLIEVCLGPATEMFEEDFPEIIKTAVKHNYGSIMGKLLNDVFFYEGKGISEPIVLEALLSIALLHCSNKYCFVMHSLRLSQCKLDSKEVMLLFDTMKFPKSIKNSKKWSQILRITFDLFKNRTESYCHKIDSIRSILTNDEFVHYRNVLALIAFLEFISHFYHEEVFIEGESTVTKYKKDIAVYIKYYEEYKAKNEDEVRLPVLVICSYCNALKDNNGEWHQVIDILPSIPQNATFTHSICDKCLAKATKEPTQSLYDNKTDWVKKIQEKLKNYGVFGIKKRLL